MKKLLKGLLLVAAITVLCGQGAHAGKKWKPSVPTTPAPAPTPPPTTGGSTGGTTGGSTGGGTPAVPEPGTMLLMGSGAAALAYARRRQTAKTQEQNAQE